MIKGAAPNRDRSTPAARALHLGRKVLAALIDGSAEAMTAIEGAAGESGMLHALSDEALARFASLVRATDAIHLAAINAALLSRSDKGQEKAMGVLSIKVQQQAAVCANASAACQSAIAQLSLAEDLDAFLAVAERANAFRAAMAEATATVETAEAALADLDALRKAAVSSMQNLDDAARTAREAVRGILAANADLACLARDLPRVLPPGTQAPDDLMALCTMESERVVHRRLFGIPATEADHNTVASAEDDPLAGAFFQHKQAAGSCAVVMRDRIRAAQGKGRNRCPVRQARFTAVSSKADLQLLPVTLAKTALPPLTERLRWQP